jgi:leucyl/phenylalanyl-tRNA--protein transferase
MGDHSDKHRIYLCNPLVRAIIPIAKLHISRSLRSFCLKKKFKFTINSQFQTVILKCADREETWINSSIISVFNKMHNLGYAHSIEIWEDNTLRGGLYGLALGKVFFAESMFSESSNGSKIALIALMGVLSLNGFSLLDVQFMTKHLKSMGAKEVSKNLFLYLLKTAASKKAHFKQANSCYVDKGLIHQAEKRVSNLYLQTSTSNSKG